MTRSRRAALSLLSVLVPASVLLGACSDDPLDDVAVEDTVESGETVETDLVSFALPEGWTVLDAETMRDRAGSEANPLLDDLAERSGIGVDRFVAQMESMELFAAAPGGAVAGLLTNVNVIEQPLPPGGVPEPEAMRPELMVFADEVGDIDELEGAVEGVRAEYLVESGRVSINGEQFYAELDDSLVVVTVSATEAGDAAEVADLIEETLAAAG